MGRFLLTSQMEHTSQLKKKMRSSKLIRKISIGKDYKNEAMHYSVGQEVYGGHTICDIIEQDDKYSIYIKKEKDVQARTAGGADSRDPRSGGNRSLGSRTRFRTGYRGIAEPGARPRSRG